MGDAKSEAMNEEGAGRSVFVSYRRLDDDPPPEKPEGGFVRYLSQQVRWELNQLGVPKAVLWRDRAKIEPGDIWSLKIEEALSDADIFLAIVSRNYVHSDWCAREISTMAARAVPDGSPKRMLRIDKHRVEDRWIPEPLRGVQAIRFYQEDAETKEEDEFFWRGRVCLYDEYISAVRRLARAIYDRLEQLGGINEARRDRAKDEPSSSTASETPDFIPIHTIFVAKPAADMLEEYRSLTRELMQRGCRVLPDPSAALPDDAEQVTRSIQDALANSPLSIHLLGKRKGSRPDGLDKDLVPFQLSAAARRALADPTFNRLIWAPKIMPRSNSADENLKLRDPIDVLSGFGDKCPTDEIDGDTAARFKEFVLQRIFPEAASSIRPNIYIHSMPMDRSFAVNIARELKALGATPLLGPETDDGSSQQIDQARRALLSEAHYAVVCWAAANRAEVTSETVCSALQAWKSGNQSKRQLILLLGPPSSNAKAEIAEFGVGSAVDRIVDASGPGEIKKIIADHFQIICRPDRS